MSAAPTSETHEHLLRPPAPEVLALLVRRYGPFDACEDAVQEALLAATLQWPADGVPANPKAWLITVAARRRTELWRSDSARRRREETVALLEPADPAPRPFALLLEAFTALDAGRDPTLLAAHFLLQLLDALGYRPELFACLNCGAELRPVVNYLSPSQGGAFCPECGPKQPGSQPIAVDGLKLMRHLQRTERLGGLVVALPPGLAEQVDRLVRAFAEHHIDRRLRSPEFISRLRELGDRAAAILPNTVQHVR
jgi:DNA-directed RNA polymerase specialized sigma24 family protein